MTIGRPLKYDSPEQMQVIIDQYFDDCAYNRSITINPDNIDDRETITSDQHPTVTGLALVLDLTRNSLITYEGREEFVNTVKKGKARVESYIEQRLYHNNAVGCIFNLKNNFGWKDKTETEMSGSIGLHDMTDEQLNQKLAAMAAKIKP